MPPRKKPADELNVLRDQLRSAKQSASIATIVRMAAAMGIHFENSPKTLSQFATGKRADLTIEADHAALRAFFATETGRLLVTNTSIDRPQEEFIHKVAKRARADMMRPGDPEMEGVYLIYNGAQIMPDHYVVRVIDIRRLPSGRLSYSPHFIDTRTALGPDDEKGASHFSSPGILIFAEHYPQFLSLHKDNAIGFVLMVTDRLVTKDGRATRIVGTMWGFNIKRQHYRRAVLIERIDGATDWRPYLEQTGIRRFEEWPAHVQRKFKKLKEWYPHEAHADPILSLPD